MFQYFKHLIHKYIFKSKSREEQFKQRVLNETNDLDFTTITHDWEKSKKLYDSLKKKCHPDLFTAEKNDISTHIFQLLTQYKYNYAKLLKIKELAEKELGISVEDSSE